jgi:PPOX class probable F420-dependent enzyme
VERADALGRVSGARIARFATITEGGRPHLVPITHALVGESVVHMVDHKPKSTHSLARIANLTLEPRATVLVDHYDEDWRRLWWVRVDGRGSVHEMGPKWAAAQNALMAKYQQYAMAPPEGPAIYLSIEKVTSWEHTE